MAIYHISGNTATQTHVPNRKEHGILFYLRCIFNTYSMPGSLQMLYPHNNPLLWLLILFMLHKEGQLGTEPSNLLRTAPQ